MYCYPYNLQSRKPQANRSPASHLSPNYNRSVCCWGYHSTVENPSIDSKCHWNYGNGRPIRLKRLACLARRTDILAVRGTCSGRRGSSVTANVFTTAEVIHCARFIQFNKRSRRSRIKTATRQSSPRDSISALRLLLFEFCCVVQKSFVSVRFSFSSAGSLIEYFFFNFWCSVDLNELRCFWFPKLLDAHFYIECFFCGLKKIHDFIHDGLY